ncbi:sensor domain-containing protein [Mycobacterium sp. SMC-13]|uniref:sensor domain-containing protein n=1 Tax=Mycobacterium sp. SMC-13 TaxID=3381626 RepID=UPI0038774A50
MSGNQWVPPQQPPTGQYPAQYPGGPPWQPGLGPGRYRGPLIIGGALIVAAAIVATALVATRDPGGASTAPAAAGGSSASSSTSAQVTTSAAAAGPVYQVVPQSTLPSAGDVSRLTGITFSNLGDPVVSPGPDAHTTPASCAFASDSTSQTTWKSARAMAGMRFVEGTVDSYNSSAGVGLAVFTGAADAASSLSVVADSVRGCTTFTVPDWNPKNAPSTWTVGDVERGDDRITWSTTVGNGWVCRRSYRVVANVAASAVVCSDKARPGSPVAMTEFVLAKATKG